MKKLSFSVILSLLAIVMLVTGVLAEGAALPGSGWWSAETIQNVGTAQANVTITAYDATSPATYIKSDTIDSGANKVYLPGDLNLPDNFQGSAIVSASQDVRAIVNVTNRYIESLVLGDRASLSPAAAQYQGMNVPATTINFPLVKNNHYGKTTTFFIQNAGSSAATATATFSILGIIYTYDTPSIEPGDMVVVTPDMARDNSIPPLPPPTGDGVVGALTVTSTQPLAGVCLEHKTSEANATVLQATRAFTSNDYDTTVFLPTTKSSYYGRFSGVQVQNVSAGPIDVDISYTAMPDNNCPGGIYTAGITGLASGASHTFYPGYGAVTGPVPAGCFAAATITATDNIVAVVNESFTPTHLADNPSVSQQSTSVGGIPASAASTVVSLPLYKENSYGKATGVTIQNVGATATTVVITFKNDVSGVVTTFVTTPQTIEAGASIIVFDARKKDASYWEGTPMTDAALGGCPIDKSGCAAYGVFGIIAVSSGENIVGMANESTYPIMNPVMKQDKNNYEGFNLTAAP